MSNSLFDLSGKTAAVIGATGVLGGSMAEALARQGASVAIIGRIQERGEQRAQAIIKQGGKAIFVTADAMSRASLESAATTIEQQLGSISILVNAAGGNKPDATSHLAASSATYRSMRGAMSSISISWAAWCYPARFSASSWREAKQAA